jgi:hypothetical protein
MVTMLMGGVVMMLDRIIVLFLLLETYRVRVFCSHPNPYRDKAVIKNKAEVSENCHCYVSRQKSVMGGCRNSFFVSVSKLSRSGLAKNIGQIRFS